MSETENMKVLDLKLTSFSALFDAVLSMSDTLVILLQQKKLYYKMGRVFADGSCTILLL